MIYVLINGDKAVFQRSFQGATVVVKPGMLEGSGPATLGGQALCVVEDKDSVVVDACMYTTPNRPIPGMGTITIAKLADDQVSKKTTTGGAAVLLAGRSGSTFEASFKVDIPAQQPTPAGPVLDQVGKKYQGQGSFVTSNTKLRES